MAFTKESSTRLELLESGHIQIRTTVKIYEDGSFLGEKLHRRVIEPNSDVSGEPAKLRNIAAIWWS